MSLFDQSSRVIDKAPAQQPIKTQDINECLFAPVLNECPIREKVRGSGYGPDSWATKSIKGFTPPESPSNPDEYYKPELPECTLRATVSSSGYGVKAVKTKKPEEDLTKTRPKTAATSGHSEASTNPHEIMPKRLKSAKALKSSTTSSGYAQVVTGGRAYNPSKHPAKRGENATSVALPAARNPTFKPQLHLSKTAKKLREKVAGRRLEPKGYRSETGLMGSTSTPFQGAPSDLLKTPTRVIAPDSRLVDSGGFILDGVAVSNREANQGRAASSDVYHGTSFIDTVNSPPKMEREKDVY